MRCGSRRPIRRRATSSSSSRDASDSAPGTDVAFIRDGYVSVTPLMSVVRAPLLGAAEAVAAALPESPPQTDARSRSSASRTAAIRSGTMRPPHPAAALLPHDEPGVGEHLRVVRHRRLRLAEGVEEIARADLAGVGHQAQEPEPHRVAERGEHPGEVVGVAFARAAPPAPRRSRARSRASSVVETFRTHIDYVMRSLGSIHRQTPMYQELVMSRVQLALNVSDLDEAITFYSKLFATEPAKVRPGYANFAVADPPLEARAHRGQRRARVAEPPRRRGESRPTRSRPPRRA